MLLALARRRCASGESSSIVMTEESWSKFMGDSYLWDFSLVGKGDRGDEVFVINFWERRVRGNAKPPRNFIDMITGTRKSDRKAEK